MDMPGAPMPPGPPTDDPQNQVSEVGQQIVQAAQKLSPDDLNALFQGVSPQAIEIMEKIPDLEDFANFIESAGKGTQGPSDQDQPGAPGKKPGIAIVIGVGKPRDPRDDIRSAAAQHGIR